MPISTYFGGKGAKVMGKMKAQYGAEKGERVFHATANKRKSKSKAKTARKPSMGGFRVGMESKNGLR